MRLFLLLLFALALSGCTIYRITPESLLTQLAASREEPTKTAGSTPPHSTAVARTDLHSIRVYTIAGDLAVLPIKRRTSVRLIRRDGSRTTLYFNTLLLQDSTFTGSTSQSSKRLLKPIPFKDLWDIEVWQY